MINASACGVIETARQHKDKIGKIYAGKNGIIGALRENLIDTDKESAQSIAALKYTPAGAFGSCRYKLKSVDSNREEYERLIEVLRRITLVISFIMAAVIHKILRIKSLNSAKLWIIH